MLTKSNYLAGLQCLKLLWILKKDEKLIPEPSEMTKSIMEQGELIGEYAKLLFPEGKDLSKDEFEKNIEKTKKLIEERLPIFEAGFLKDELYSRADILVPVEKDKWDIIEVKSSTDIKDVNIHDVSFQKYVYEKAGLKINNCYIMHINNQYIRNGEIEPNELFIKADITEKITEFSIDIEKRIQEMIQIIESENEYQNKIGIHCSTPYECNLKHHCWSEIPKESIFNFTRILKKKAFELYHLGIIHMKDVPEDVKLNEKQKIQKFLAAKGGGIHKDKKQIKYFIENLNYPIYYLDFETINAAIPKFDNSKPYQQIPFQYSLHIQEKQNGELKHISFLAEGIKDPRQNFLQSLKENLGNSGDILVYNQRFEKMILNQSVETFQEFKSWNEENIIPRIKDLYDVFGKFWYYDSKQNGSASIKAVLPAMSDLSYEHLDIKKGDVASREFERVTYGDVSEEERQKIRKDLEKYCELDTLAEVKIIEALYKEQ